jgi:alpha-tubulin suppressor-like RCC1 family protein
VTALATEQLVQLALGDAHSAVMTSKGRVYVWGGAGAMRQCWPVTRPQRCCVASAHRAHT